MGNVTLNLPAGVDAGRISMEQLDRSQIQLTIPKRQPPRRQQRQRQSPFRRSMPTGFGNAGFGVSATTVPLVLRYHDKVPCSGKCMAWHPVLSGGSENTANAPKFLANDQTRRQTKERGAWAGLKFIYIERAT